MNIVNYFKKLQEKSSTIFIDSLSYKKELAEIHDFSSSLYEITNIIKSEDEKYLIEVICAQLESSCLTATYGLYRQAMTSLRLAFELGLGLVHFSTNNLEFKEWQRGSADISWAKLVDPDNGVLSQRFAASFFPELAEQTASYNSRARTIYRKLSEFVHGNSETWKTSGLKINKNEALIEQYFEHFREVSEVLTFAFLKRYLSECNAHQIEEISSLTERLNHIDQIRTKVGGPGVPR